MILVRQLNSSDRIDTDVFLEKHAESCMFMRSHIAIAGLTYRGLPNQGDHFGAFRDGKLVGVIAHYWNGNVMIEAKDGIAELGKAVIKNAFNSGRSIRGILGSFDQAQELIEVMDIQEWPRTVNSKEHLLAMSLKDLKVPALCHDPDFYRRDPKEQDRDLMMKWRFDYEMEFGSGQDNETSRARIARDVEDFMSNGKYWLFEYQEKPVAFSGFNAVTDDTVQPSVVWVSPENRTKGFASPIVASILLVARDRWEKKKTVIFSQNEASEKAYTALGYKDFGYYSLIMFQKPYLPMM